MRPGARALASAFVIAERLSALDASFLAVEGPTAPMHVGWVALFDPPQDAGLPMRAAENHDPAPGHPERAAEWLSKPVASVTQRRVLIRA